MSIYGRIRSTLPDSCEGFAEPWPISVRLGHAVIEVHVIGLERRVSVGQITLVV
jgi:hypothetical protein